MVGNRMKEMKCELIDENIVKKVMNFENFERDLTKSSITIDFEPTIILIEAFSNKQIYLGRIKYLFCKWFMDRPED